MFDVIQYLKAGKNIKLNPQQQKAILQIEGNTLLLAVPGSGKTTVLVARIAHMILNQRVPTPNILTLTFSKAGALDMSDRFQSLFGEIISDIPRFSTIHSFCYQVLRKYAGLYHRKMPGNIETADADISKSLLLRQINNRINDEFIGDDQLENLSSEISFVKNMLLNETQIQERRNGFANFDLIFREYERVKKENNFIDFDDMLVIALEILQRFPAILDGYTAQYPHINIDEAQDTSKAQHAIIKLLSQKGTSLFMVGDEDQSIYSFRGAFPRGLLNFEREYANSSILKMEENFRSPSDIVDKANHFIKHNRDRYDKNMVSMLPSTGNIQILCLHEYSMQYEHIVSALHKIPPGETAAVIYRNNESALPFIDMFEKERIPFRVKENKGYFFDSFIVKDIISFFRLSYDPKDIQSFKQVYYKLHFSNLMFAYVEKNIHLHNTVFDALLSIQNLPDYRKTKIKMLKKDFEKIKKLQIFDGITYIEKFLEYRKYLDSKAGGGFTIENLHHKLNILKTIAKGYPKINDFFTRLQEIKNRIVSASTQTGCETVTLTTVHSCKGLEFDHVFLVDLADGQFPSKDAVNLLQMGNRQGMEEETRLFYVGATRARKKLYLFTADAINGEKASRSRFIKMFTEPELSTVRLLSGNGISIRRQKGYNAINAYEYEGDSVNHRFFGLGVITEVLNEEQVKVQFDRFGIKEISLSYCVNNNIIKFLNRRGNS